jgi:hypothetical protein
MAQETVPNGVTAMPAFKSLQEAGAWIAQQDPATVDYYWTNNPDKNDPKLSVQLSAGLYQQRQKMFEAWARGDKGAVLPSGVGQSGSGAGYKGDMAPAGVVTGQIVKTAEDTKTQTLADIKKMASDYTNLITNSGGTATTKSDAALKKLQDAMQAHPELKPADYVGDTTSKAATAAGDAGAIDTQKQVLQKLVDRSNPEVTAQEKALQEQASQKQQQDEAASRSALMSSLAQRGIKSGGAEVAGAAAGGQQQSQNRMISDLGTAAGAVSRATENTKAAGVEAGQIRDQSFNEDYQRGTAADIADRFNKTAKSAYNEWADKFGQSERDKAVGREQDVFNADQGTAQNDYLRNIDPAKFAQGNASLEAGAALPASAQVGGAYKTVLGADVTRDATDALQPKDPWAMLTNVIKGY